MRLQTIILALCPLLLFSGCALLSADYRYQQTLQQWQGRPIDYATSRLGRPHITTTAYYGWVYFQQIEHEGRWVNTDKRQNFYDKHGRLVGYTYVPVSEYQQPWTEYRNCTTRIYINSQRAITRFQFSGNYCGHWFEGNKSLF